MPQDPNLYGQRPAKKQKHDANLSSSLDFTAQLTSLMSNTNSSKQTSGRPRPSRAPKDDLFQGRKSSKQKNEHGSDEKLVLKEVAGTEDEAQERTRAKRNMENKARLYAAMKRGDYIPKEGEQGPLVDFDRKWAEDVEGQSNGETSSDEDDEDDGGEIVEYEDEFGRVRQVTKSEKERLERRARRGYLNAYEHEQLSARPSAPSNLIYGDAVQSMAFNPENEEEMEALARKRDRSATPPEMKHYDADHEIRTKGTGFYKFSRDEETRKQEMESLEEERKKTEQQRREREDAREARKKDIEKRHHQQRPEGALQDAINHPPTQLFTPQAVKIQSHDFNNFNNHPTQPSPQISPSVDLNFSTASPSNRYSSVQTANITGSDFPVFTTDPQSTWPPQSASPSLSASNDLSLNNNENNNNQDFVLFDSPPPNRPAQLRSTRRPSSTNQSATARNNRVSQILQATGHNSQQPSSPVNVNANLFDHQFYASSAPSSTVSLNQHSRPNRPPVPLFHQSTGSVPTAKMMNAADVDLDEFTAFGEGGHTAFSSPAMMPTFGFNGNQSANSSSSNLPGTVSPNDLFVTDNLMSAPNSSALTALTSPSINESPEFDSYDVSPHFQSGDFGVAPSSEWFSLFPDNASAEQKQPEFSPEQRTSDVDSPQLGVPTRRKSGNTSPTTSARHSSVSGVSSRKRDKPLPPIVIDNPNDTVAMKRARNTLAARKSRERKAQRFEDLEDKIAKLEAERDHWKRIALSQGASQN